jgi:hypothetical protein
VSGNTLDAAQRAFLNDEVYMKTWMTVPIGLAVFVSSVLLMTLLLVSILPPDVGGVRRVACLIALVFLPAALALLSMRIVSRRAIARV